VQIDVILEPDLTPDQVAELAVAAENYGFRTLWHSNYHQNPDAFISLVPAALATSRINLGILAISPQEMPPLKMGNALLTLNEIAGGRAVLAIGGGGAVLSSLGSLRLDRKAMRMLTAVREGIEIVQSVVSGEDSRGYDGEVFSVSRPYHHTWKTAPTAQVFACASGPKMLEMSGRVADGLQMSDVPPERIVEKMEHVRTGLAQRTKPVQDFRIGNFWAWHIKSDAERSMYEARRELVWRGGMFPPRFDLPEAISSDERQVVADHHVNFVKAFWTRSGVIDDVPEELVEKLIANLSSAGGLDAIDAQIERFRLFEEAGLTEISIRLFDEPMAGLEMLAERVLPHFDRY
jgi:5,10-methylenetetrahydromethanopterin reductase